MNGPPAKTDSMDIIKLVFMNQCSSHIFISRIYLREKLDIHVRTAFYLCNIACKSMATYIANSNKNRHCMTESSDNTLNILNDATCTDIFHYIMLPLSGTHK